MDISESYRRHLNLIKVVFLTIIIILFSEFTKVNATVNNNLNIDINNKIYSTPEDLSDNIIDNLMIAITGKIDGYKVVLDDNLIGYIYKQNDIKDIKDILLEEYLKDSKIKEDNILSFEIKSDIKAVENRFEVGLLNTKEELITKIYDSIKEKNLIKVKYKEKELKSIKATTMIIPTDELYIGETKIEEGKDGLIIQTKEVSIEDGKIIKEKVISEDTIEEEVSKKIYRGTKNPYEDGVAFLNHPTRGGYMTSGYGERWNSFHKGIDIAGDIGDDVIAAMDGEVIYAEFNDGGYGNLIIITHEDDMKTYYGHLNGFKVNVGDKIKKGDVIGELGNTGYSTGPHLHFELRVNNNPVDPINYIVQ